MCRTFAKSSMRDIPGICRSKITASIRGVSRTRSASSPLAGVSQGKPSCASTAAMTFRTEISSSTINTRRVTESAKGIGSVAKRHPAFASSWERVETSALLFDRAGYGLIQKEVLVHGVGHLPQNLMARKSNNLNQLVAAVRCPEFPFSGSNAGIRLFVPLWDQIHHGKKR